MCEGPSREERNCSRYADMKSQYDMSQLALAELTLEVQRLREKMCHNISCQNGGVCQEGECHCPEGYSGVNCEDSNNGAWYLAKESGKSCNDVCSEEGKTCDGEKLKEINSEEKFKEVELELGLSCRYYFGFATAPGAPSYHDHFCNFWNPQGPNPQCDYAYDWGKRLCYCQA